MTDRDVVVVGAGPAGLTAAAELAESGLHVVALDENTTAGGQYYRRRSGAVRAALGDWRPAGTALLDRARAAGVEIRLRTTVWGVDDDGATLLAADATDLGSRWRGAATVLATGAHERSLPFPGWELPGVVTPGAALHLATLDGVAVGRRVVVAGSGPFLLPVAAAVTGAGGRVLGVFEAATPYRPHPRVLAHPRRVAQFVGYRARLAAARVPVRSGWRVRAAVGADRVTAVELEHRDGRRRRLACDALAVGHGFRANTELAVLLGAAVETGSPEGRGVRRDGYGATSVPGLVVAGEVAGVAGVEAALARGVLAAHAVAGALGRSGPHPRRVRAALAAARRAEDFAALSARLFATDPVDVPDATLVCRCEGVTAGELRAARELAAGDLGAGKGLSRVGMGVCQGRQCGPAVAALLGATSPFTPRMPVKPLPVAALAALADE